MEASDWSRVNLAGVSVLTDRIVSSNRVADDCFILRNIPKCQHCFSVVLEKQAMAGAEGY